MTKKCGVCGETLATEAIVCPQCGRGVFESEKRFNPTSAIERNRSYLEVRRKSPRKITRVPDTPTYIRVAYRVIRQVTGLLERCKKMRLFRKYSDEDISNLMAAIDGDHLPTVKAAFDRDPGLIRAQDQHYGTALHRAAIKGRMAIAELLVSRGANVRARKKRHRDTPLHYAAQMGHLDIASLLISRGADVNTRDYQGMTPLDSAAYGGSCEAIELLLGHDARSGGSAVAHAVTVFGHTKVVEYLLDRGFPLTAWHGESPLHWAASSGFAGIADLLICRGADVNVRDPYGRTPLHAAAGCRDEDVGQVLERTCPRDTYDVVTLLIAKGADVNARDKRGETPIAVAIGNGRVSAVLALDAHVEREQAVDLLTEGFLSMDAEKRNKTVVFARVLSEQGNDCAVQAIERAIRQRRRGRECEFYELSRARARHTFEVQAAPAELLALAINSQLWELPPVAVQRLIAMCNAADLVADLVKEIQERASDEQARAFQLLATHLQLKAALIMAREPARNAATPNARNA